MKADRRLSGRLLFIIWHCRAWANSLGNHAEVPSVSFLPFNLESSWIIRIFGPDYY